MIQDITHYLTQFLDQEAPHSQSARGLEYIGPSMDELADRFHCGQLTVYDALQQLKNQYGYDYAFRSLSDQLHFWKRLP